MLLLLTIVLVLIGAVALVIGFVGGDQLPIFISIACSLLAGGVLVVFSRMSRRQGVAPATGPAPLAGDAGRASDEEVEEAVGEPEPAAVGAGDRAFAAGGEVPIQDYDELLVSEILPLLADLDADELAAVRAHEEDGKARATLLRRIDQLVEEREGAPTLAAVPAGRGGGFRDVRDEEEEEEDEQDEIAGEGDLMFPIEDYDDLRVSEILPLLPELYDDELELVAERESEGANRASILNRIEELLGGAPAPAPAPKKAAPKKVATKKAAPAKTPARKAPAKKATPAKRPAAKKASTTKKTATKKAAPAKKAATKKTAAKKTAAKRR